MSLYEYGIKKEIELMPKINDFIYNIYGKSIKKTEGKYNLFDFKAKKIRIELKSRKVYSYTYEDTMIDTCKILKGLRLMKKDYDIFFFFNFHDGLFYYKLKEGDDQNFRNNIIKYKAKHYFNINKLIKI